MRTAVVEALARTYGADVRDLTGEKQTQDEGRFQEHYPELTALMPREFHNALAAVCFHYGVAPEVVLGNSPLLFASAAERSLRARREALAQRREVVTAVQAVMSSLEHMPRLVVTGTSNSTGGELNADEILAEEAQSIDARDIVGHAPAEEGLPVDFR